MAFLVSSMALMIVTLAPYSTDQSTVVYAAPEGEELKATLFLPQDGGERLRPAVVLIHGGGWVAGTRHLVHSYGREFAEQGYVGLAINYRKMPGDPFPACLEDAKAAVRWLRLHAETYRIDPERIGAFGKSAGGHLATLLATTGPDDGFEGTDNAGPPSTVQAVVSLYGVYDLSMYPRSRDQGLIAELKADSLGWFVGAESGGNLEDFSKASPVAYVSADACPHLLIHGADDNMVPVKQAQTYKAALDAAGVPNELVIVPDRGHGFDYVFRDERRELLGQVLDFFADYLVTDAPGQ